MKINENFKLVPKEGIEPTHPKILDFESSASTSSATSAYICMYNSDNAINLNELQVFLNKKGLDAFGMGMFGIKRPDL
jgi:hypothetical protein